MDRDGVTSTCSIKFGKCGELPGCESHHLLHGLRPATLLVGNICSKAKDGKINCLLED